jgi:hypothetical protein
MTVGRDRASRNVDVHVDPPPPPAYEPTEFDRRVASYLIGLDATQDAARRHFNGITHEAQLAQISAPRFNFDYDAGWSEYTPGEGWDVSVSMLIPCSCGQIARVQANVDDADSFAQLVRGICS